MNAFLRNVEARIAAEHDERMSRPGFENPAQLRCIDCNLPRKVGANYRCAQCRRLQRLRDRYQTNRTADEFMVELRRVGGAVKPAELAKRLDVTRNAAYQALRKLEKAGRAVLTDAGYVAK